MTTDKPLITHWIGGRRHAEPSSRTGDVFNPATGRVAAKVALASAEDVDAAVEIAVDAATSWGETSLAARTSVLFRVRERLEARIE